MISWVVHGRIYVSSFQTIGLLPIDKAVIQFVSIYFFVSLLFSLFPHGLFHTRSHFPPCYPTL